MITIFSIYFFIGFLINSIIFVVASADPEGPLEGDDKEVIYFFIESFIVILYWMPITIGFFYKKIKGI